VYCRLTYRILRLTDKRNVLRRRRAPAAWFRYVIYRWLIYFLCVMRVCTFTNSLIASFSHVFLRTRCDYLSHESSKKEHNKHKWCTHTNFVLVLTSGVNWVQFLVVQSHILNLLFSTLRYSDFLSKILPNKYFPVYFFK
jgi:magnesium-transporting ATPase (P-type)